jgi:hypothetical protein
MINAFNVSYPDFKVGEVIYPDELDVNFADIGIRINQCIDVLNRITDGIGGTGTGIIHVGDVLPFTSANLQIFLDELLTKLQSDVALDSGANFIGASFVQGLVGNNVQDLIESLKTIHDALDARQITDTAFLNGRVDGQIAEISILNGRVTDNEALTNTKANAVTTYSKTETDVIADSLEAQVYNDMYTKSQANTLLNAKTNSTGNHAGTWQGINVSQLAGVLGIDGAVVDTVQPSAPYEGLLWFNPFNQQYTIYRGGQWRFNGIPSKLIKKENRYTASAITTSVPHGITEYHKDYDVLLVFKNSVMLSEDGDYVINAGGTGVTLTEAIAVGTTIDFVAMISAPVIGAGGSSRIADLEARMAVLEASL